jgi:hypothetical protein
MIVILLRTKLPNSYNLPLCAKVAETITKNLTNGFLHK